MPGKKPNLEVEIKLRVIDAGALRLRLKQLRAQEIVPRTYERNTLYDTQSKALRRKGQLIRIRIEKLVSSGRKTGSGHGGGALLTYKGPGRPSRKLSVSLGKGNKSSRFKIREEIELTVGSAERMSEILRALGLSPAFRYEKFRTTFALPGIQGLKLEFDETPVGNFLELEGPAAAIDRAARLIGYPQLDYMTDTYGALYIADCQRRNRKPTNMLFQPTKSLR